MADARRPGTAAPNVEAPSPTTPSPTTPGTVAPSTVAPGTVAPGTVAPSTVAPGTATSRLAWRLADRRGMSVRDRGARLLMILTALLVLRGIQAAVAGLTVLAVTVSRFEHPAPTLHLARLAEVEPAPMTAVTALTMILASAGLAAVLLPRRQVLAAFAGIKAFALVAASALTVMFTAEPASIRAAVAGCGVGIVALFWPAARDAAGRVLAAVGLPHPHGRAGDLILAVKIALLVAIVAIPV
ncbi:histidine kinase [Pseudofrankia sp. BMG5.37]|uniref:histidine kinase n=1 Tax=Pseudofrankia sp. BMG5.37 TaxID=3050035 RepID=UPI002894D064|nr:histidine kinase [Pseudofrankia sp. BMG5.37]MDT3438946.1 histidine kinase [Pseudofrankia sp. BMG5.37]